MATTTDYTGRKVDFSFFPRTTSGVTVEASLRPQPLVIAGPLKASQNFARIILSSLGERKESPQYGSNLLKELSSGYIRYPVQIEQIFSQESLRVLDYIRRNTPVGYPADETIDSVNLLDYSMESRGSLTLSVQIHLVSGDTETFLLPVVWSKS